MKRLIQFALIAALGLLSACSQKSKLAGTWKAESQGEVILTLNSDGSASGKVEGNGLLGRFTAQSSGTWSVLDGSKLMLEFGQDGGARAAEVNKFEFDKGDLILTSEKSGAIVRYKRVEEAGKKSQAAGGSDKDKQVQANLQRIVDAAKEAMYLNDKKEVTFAELSFNRPIVPQFGESYENLVIRVNEPVSITVNGKTYRVEFN